MQRISVFVLLLAVLFLAGCGGGSMPVTPSHAGSSSGSGSSSTSSTGPSSSGSSSSASSGSGTSSSGSSGSSSSSSGSSGSGSSSSVVGPSEFTFSGYDWETHNGSAPPVGNVNGNVGTFDPMNVSVGSELVLSLTQTQNGSQILSSGSEVMTKQTFSYGTFEFASRVDNVLSGSDSSGFLYAPNSSTEIDMEQVGNKPDAVDCTNWKGVADFQDTEITGFHQGNSHDFKIVWASTHVDWYVDGQLVVSHTQAVPSAPAPFLFNMWGTNKSTWGGMATIGPTRYMYISNFKYTP
jgi:glycosyl hydrolase family 16